LVGNAGPNSFPHEAPAKDRAGNCPEPHHKPGNREVRSGGEISQGRRRQDRRRYDYSRTGSISAEGRVRSCQTVCAAFSSLVSVPRGPPVFGFRSKRGKLLLETSRRMRWPFKKTLLVTPASTSIRYTSPGCASLSFSSDSR